MHIFPGYGVIHSMFIAIDAHLGTHQAAGYTASRAEAGKREGDDGASKIDASLEASKIDGASSPPILSLYSPKHLQSIWIDRELSRWKREKLSPLAT